MVIGRSSGLIFKKRKNDNVIKKRNKRLVHPDKFKDKLDEELSKYPLGYNPYQE